MFQNLLFYYETETSSRPSGLIFLEGSYCERLIAPNCIGPPGISSPIHKQHKEEKLQVGSDSIMCHNDTNRNCKNFQHCFSISYRRENQRQYDLKAANESECATWIVAIREARFLFDISTLATTETNFLIIPVLISCSCKKKNLNKNTSTCFKLSKVKRQQSGSIPNSARSWHRKLRSCVLRLVYFLSLRHLIYFCFVSDMFFTSRIFSPSVGVANTCGSR